MAATEKILDEYLYNPESSLEKIKPVEFSWTDDQSTTIGFTAHELGTLTTYGGTSHPSYGAIPGAGITTGIGVNTVNTSPVWTTTTNNTGGYSFAAVPNTTTIGQSGKLHIQGKNADLVIGDKSMKTWMERVEEQLNILTPNPELEKEWDDLRRLGERYRKLEKKCQEKAAMWKQLKSMPKPDVK